LGGNKQSSRLSAWAARIDACRSTVTILIQHGAAAPFFCQQVVDSFIRNTTRPMLLCAPM